MLKMERFRLAMRSDCTQLIETFASHGSTDFSNFCKEWKIMHFQHIYSGLMHDFEIIQLTGELLHIIKRILISDRPTIERVGALYLLYTIYYQQPTKEYCKIKVTVNDWKQIKEFLEHLQEITQNKQPELIFHKLLSSNAFRYVISDIDYGLEGFFNSNKLVSIPEDKTIKKINYLIKTNLNDVLHDQNGLLTGFELLEDGYNEMKEILNKENTKESNKQILNLTNIAKDFKDDLKKLENILDIKKVGYDKSSSDDDESENINDRRKRIKSKAFTGNKNLKTNHEYDISIAGDFIKVVQNPNCERKTPVQRTTQIFAEELPEETLNELRIPSIAEEDQTIKPEESPGSLLDILPPTE